MPGFIYIGEDYTPLFSPSMVERNIRDENLCLACRLNMAMYIYEYQDSHFLRGKIDPMTVGYGVDLLKENAGKTVKHVRVGDTGCFAHDWKFEREITLTGLETRRHILPQHAAWFKGDKS